MVTIFTSASLARRCWDDFNEPLFEWPFILLCYCTNTRFNNRALVVQALREKNKTSSAFETSIAIRRRSPLTCRIKINGTRCRVRCAWVLADGLNESFMLAARGVSLKVGSLALLISSPDWSSRGYPPPSHGITCLGTLTGAFGYT